MDTKPDAVLFPDSYKTGGTMAERIAGVTARLEPILGGKPVWIADVGGGRYLARLDHNQRLQFDEGHPLAKTPRYDWTDGPDGLKLGTLKPEARETDALATQNTLSGPGTADAH